MLDSLTAKHKRNEEIAYFGNNHHFQGARKVKAHGIGEFNFDQVVNFGNEDLKALSDVLADKPFFFGDEPTMVRKNIAHNV